MSEPKSTQNHITLSILIPTYNRVKFLETTVECIAKQIIEGKYEHDIELLIGNDASPDPNTALYVERVAEMYSFAKSYSHPKNLGLSQNIEFLVERAVGTYTLICGEDDLFADGALTYFIEQLKTRSPNYILINTSNIISHDDANKDYSIVLENRLKIHQNIYVEDVQKEHDKLRDAYNWIYLTNLLPAVIFKTDLFIHDMDQTKKFLRPENLFLWQGAVIVGLSTHGKFLIIAKPYVLHRKNETHWTHDSRSMVHYDIFDNAEVAKLIKEYIPPEYIRYKKLYASFVMSGLLIEAKQKKPSVRTYAWYAFAKYLTCFPENLEFLFMSISPHFIVLLSNELRALKKVLR